MLIHAQASVSLRFWISWLFVYCNFTDTKYDVVLIASYSTHIYTIVVREPHCLTDTSIIISDHNCVHSGAPVAPLNVRLYPDPNQYSRYILSWDPPSNILEGISVNYTVIINVPTVNKSEITSDTVYGFNFPDEGNQPPQEHVFSLFATNPAGSGAVTTIKETLPKGKIVLVIN